MAPYQFLGWWRAKVDASYCYTHGEKQVVFAVRAGSILYQPFVDALLVEFVSGIKR